MKFGPFNGGLKGHGVLLREAGLVNNTSTITNEWFKIYDFTAEHAGIVPDGDKMNVNVSRHWRIMKREEEDDIWCPLGPAENRIPRVDPDDGETTDDKREDRNDATEKEKEKEEEVTGLRPTNIEPPAVAFQLTWRGSRAGSADSMKSLPPV